LKTTYQNISLIQRYTSIS